MRLDGTSRYAWRTYFGGPWDGKKVVIQEGWPLPDCITHTTFESTGRYVRHPDGRYCWEYSQ